MSDVRQFTVIKEMMERLVGFNSVVLEVLASSRLILSYIIIVMEIIQNNI